MAESNQNGKYSIISTPDGEVLREPVQNEELGNETPTPGEQPHEETGLLPCPFCGSVCLVSHQVAYEQWIVCNDCGAEGPSAEDNSTDEPLWNRRVTSVEAEANPLESETRHTQSASISKDLRDTLGENLEKLQEQLDLNRDEFLRIKASPGCTDEIVYLCERSQKRIVQNVPLIKQRDMAINVSIAEKARRLEVEAILSQREPLISSDATKTTESVLQPQGESYPAADIGEENFHCNPDSAFAETPQAQGQAPATDERQPEACLWLIWSNEHHAWWGANERGYVKTKGNAGQYAFDKAVSICRSDNRGLELPNETMLPVLVQRDPQAPNESQAACASSVSSKESALSGAVAPIDHPSFESH